MKILCFIKFYTPANTLPRSMNSSSGLDSVCIGPINVTGITVRRMVVQLGKPTALSCWAVRDLVVELKVPLCPEF